MHFLHKIWSFIKGIFSPKKGSPEESHKMHEHMSEKKIDKMVESSFPSSDPPSTY